jgi:uncharacterized protein (DUF488 family)
MSEQPRIYTVGHSTREIRDFLLILKRAGVRTLADVRRFPFSPRYPQFSTEALASSLSAKHFKYIHIPELGGRRAASKTSTNDYWTNPQFRGYADHMATEEFARGIATLLNQEGPVAVMCAEAVPWRCHRNMLADELVRRGFEVIHLLTETTSEPHRMNEAAREEGDHLVYPKSPQKKLFS